jgi:hypothetical protein
MTPDELHMLRVEFLDFMIAHTNDISLEESYMLEEVDSILANYDLDREITKADYSGDR